MRSLRFQHVGLEQGLPMQSVQTIAQDAQGFLWMGGQAGLVRFDGYRFTLYKNKSDDIHSLNNDWIRQIYFDRHARMWVITAAGGLHLYDRVNDHFQRFIIPGGTDSQVQNSAVNDIIDDGQQGLWLGTENGLAHFTPASGKIRWWHHQAEDISSLAHERINSMALDAHGQLWLGTENGLDLLTADGNSFVHHQADSRPDADKKNNAVNTVLIDVHGHLWLGMRKGMLSWMKGKPWGGRTRVSLPEKIKQASIKQLYQDQAGQIWIVPHAQGALRWNPVTNNMQQFLHEAGDSTSLADDQVETVFQDRSGSLWLGYWTSGASHVDLLGPAFRRYVAAERPGSLSNPKVTSIVEAVPGQLLLGSFGGGLNILDLATGIASDGNSTYGLNGKTVLSLYYGQKNKVWVATETGIASIDLHARKAQPRAVKTGEPPTHQLQNITVDRSGIFWSANTRGLLRLDPASNQLSSLRHSSTDSSSIAHDGVIAVLEDSQDRFWVGTLEGLDLLDRGSMRFRHFRHDPKDAASLGSNFVTFLFEDSQKNLWLGTSDGLSKMQTNQLGQISFDNYATNSTVDCILEDQAGKLWLSTDTGIARFDPVSQQFRYFTGKDGLIDGGYYSSSCFRDAQHTMYFGGLNGLSSFQPAEIRENAIPPPVLITGLQIFNQPQTAGKTAEGFSLQGQIQDSKVISLSYQHTVFSLEFAALHFADPQRNRYAYQLLGFDKEWVYTDASRRFATYTNLDPGEYLFRVKAANKDGIWNETGTELRITITPPYWKTWWFRVLLACILFTFLWMAYRYRLHQLLQQKKRLEVEVDKRTAEIAQQKQEIESKTDELEKTVGVLALANKLQLEHQSELTRFLAVASHDLRQPMHALNLYLEALSMEELTGSSLGLLSKLKKCAGTMDGMFLSLLDLSRLDAQIVEPNVTEFSLALLLKKIELEFAPQAQEKSLYFTVAETQAWVNSDSDLLEQILRNLVANAIRYTHSGGIELSCTAVGQHLNLTVSDTGIGISVHQQETVFQEFFQASGHRRDSSKGLGLGLAIVKRLCNLLNIPMVLHSDLGKGSQFSLLLRQLQVPADAASALHFEREDTSQLNGKRIIIIDDDDAILHATQSCLLQWHCLVTTGHSSTEVIYKIADDIRIPDIIICDYQLGGNENGLEAIANLRDMFNHDIPALIITGDMQVEERLKNTGDAMPILYKPVSIGVLQTTLGQMVLAQRLTPKASDESLD